MVEVLSVSRVKRRIGCGLLATALLSAALYGKAQAEQKPPRVDLIGINMSAAGFGGQVLPGVEGTNYFYPTEDYFRRYAAKGIRFIRFPFLWERVQPQLGGELDQDQIALLTRTLDFAQKYQMRVILDLHNYARYRGQLIGSPQVPYASYADVWKRLATTFQQHPALYGYDIMNEPHDTQGLWPQAAQTAVDSIRTVDRQTPIFVEGDGWAAAHRWPQVNGNLLIKDPADNLIYEAHIYFDEDSSGNYATGLRGAHAMIGVERVRPFVEWLKAHNLRGYLGEYGIPAHPQWLEAMDNLLTYLGEQCIPSSYWAAGPGWGDYPLAIEPKNGAEKPQVALLEKHLQQHECTAIGPL